MNILQLRQMCIYISTMTGLEGSRIRWNIFNTDSIIGSTSLLKSKLFKLVDNNYEFHRGRKVTKLGRRIGLASQIQGFKNAQKYLRIPTLEMDLYTTFTVSISQKSWENFRTERYYKVLQEDGRVLKQTKGMEDS